MQSIKSRIAELNLHRKQYKACLDKFSHLADKSVKRNTRAQADIATFGKQYSEMFISDCDIIQKGKFDFSRLQSKLSDTIERIHVLDTIETLDLPAYVTAMEAVIAIKAEFRTILGRAGFIGKSEIDRITGLNF